MKKLLILYLSLVALFFPFAINAHAVLADGGCLTINNGGTTTQQFCPTPTPAQSTQVSNQQISNQQQNNGSQQVYPSSSGTKTTPNTGPNDWTLPGLLTLAGVGLLLRNKTKRSFKIH